MGRWQYADQGSERNRAQQPIAESPSPAKDVAAQHAVVALQRARLDLPALSSSDVLALQRTIGNAAVNQLLRTCAGQRTTDRSPVQRQAGSDAPSPGAHAQRSGPRLVIQRMGIEEFYHWFNRALILDTVEQRHAFLLHALGWAEFGSFQYLLQQTNNVHRLFGQNQPQPQAPQPGSPYSPSHPTSPYSLASPMSSPYSPSQPTSPYSPSQPTSLGPSFQPQPTSFQPQPTVFGFGMSAMPPQPSQPFGLPWGGMGGGIGQYGSFVPPQMGVAPVHPPSPQVDPAVQGFLNKFDGKDLPGQDWEVFTSHDGYRVNVHWHHILNHTYLYMYTTEGRSKQSHSLFPHGTTAADVARYIQEAIDHHYPSENPTLSCGRVNIGWDSTRRGHSMTTLFLSLPDGHPDKLGSREFDLLQEHYDFD